MRAFQRPYIKKFITLALVSALLVSFVLVSFPTDAATETKYASSHITGSFLNPTNANGSTTGTWAGELNTNSNYTSRWSMEDPSGTITGTQTIAVLARKGSNANTPNIAINLYENGSLVQSVVGATDVTSTSGQTISGTFNASAISNPNNVEIEVVEVGAGGSPSARNSAQIDYIRWTVNLQDITTTLGDGTDPGNQTIGPGASATEIGRFSFQTSAGTDTVAGITVTLGPANAYTNIDQVEIQTTAGVQKCATSGLVSNSVPLAFCDISVTTTPTEYKIMITPKSHTNMPVPSSGASYDTTATVTDWSGTNVHAGSDTDSATITIDNLSPGNVTGATVTNPYENRAYLSWTDSADGVEIVVLRDTSAISDTPVEGVDYSVSNTIGSATVVCAVSSLGFCSDETVTSGTAYHYKIFAKDARGNYSDGGTVPSGSPITPVAATLSLSAYRFFEDSTSYTPGTALAAQDTPATLTSSGEAFRMRALVHVANNGISFSIGRDLKLQYAPQSGTCDVGFTGEEYHDVSATTTIAYYDVAGLSDNMALGAQSDMTHSGHTIVNQNYEEASPAVFTSTMTADQDGKWDFSLIDNGGVADSVYCMRLVQDDESVFSTYTVVAEIVMAPAGSADITLLHYRWRKDNKEETSTSFAVAEDSILNSSVFVGDRSRLRILLSNAGTGPATNYTYRLEYSSGACSSWSSVGSIEDAGPWVMDYSVYITDEMSTTDNTGLTNPGGYTFVAGRGKAGSNQTSAHTLSTSEFTELEFVVSSTDAVSTETTYCFRVTNAGSTTNLTYSVTPQISIPNQARPQKESGGSISNSGVGTPQSGGGEVAPPPIEEEEIGELETGGTAGGGGGELE